jgi:DNA-directed RNA polymerase specialized sigma24 family protein
LTQSKKTDDVPWWELELPVIRNELGAYLSRRLSAWRADHDDLVSDTLLALTREIRDRSSAYPGSWFQPKPPANEAERSHLHKLAMVILKRRIADLFRKRAPFSNMFVTGEQHPDVADPDVPTPERKVLLARMLEVTLSVLSGMQPADRDLIAFVAGEAGLRKALDARERQRLHRLRAKLRAEILRCLGADAADLLRNTD